MTDKETLILVREYINYDPETGILSWKKTSSNAAQAGKLTSPGLNDNGYHQIQIKGKSYKAHRLAWMIHYGEMPKGQIDHINGIRTDNRIDNLRCVTSQMNTHNQRKAHINNKCGYLGVSRSQNGKFRAEIRVNGKKIHLGTFESPEEAYSAYLTAKSQLHIGSIYASTRAAALRGRK